MTKKTDVPKNVGERPSTIEKVALEGIERETSGPASAKRRRELAAFRSPGTDPHLVMTEYESWERDNEQRALTAQQKKFALELAYDPNPRRAAQKAGYNLKFASANAYRLARDSRVKMLVAFHQRHMGVARNVTVDRVVAELARLGFSNISAFGDWDADGNFHLRPSSELPPEVLAAVESVDSTTETVRHKDGSTTTTHRTKLKLHPKVKSLENLAHILGAFQDNVNINVNKQVNHLHSFDTKTLADIKNLMEKAKAGGKKDGEVIDVVAEHPSLPPPEGQPA